MFDATNTFARCLLTTGHIPKHFIGARLIAKKENRINHNWQLTIFTNFIHQHWHQHPSINPTPEHNLQNHQPPAPNTHSVPQVRVVQNSSGYTTNPCDGTRKSADNRWRSPHCPSWIITIIIIPHITNTLEQSNYRLQRHASSASWPDSSVEHSYHCKTRLSSVREHYQFSINYY